MATARKHAPHPVEVDRAAVRPSIGPAAALPADIAAIDPRAQALLDAGGRITTRNAAFAGLFEDRAGRAGEAALANAARALLADGGDRRTLSLRLSGAVARAELMCLPQPTAEAAVVAFVTEITDEAARLRQLEAERSFYQDLLSSCSDWVWTVDLAGRITSLSGAITRLLGRPASRLKGGRFADFADFTAEGVEDLSGLPEFKRRSGFRDREIVIRTARGERLRQRIAGVPQFDAASGEFLGFCGTGLDLSREAAIEAALSDSHQKLEAALLELREKNVALQQALTASEAANLAKAGFLAGMSHELRTPLNAVIGYAEALASGVIQPGSDKHKRISTDIASSGRLLLRLINDILDLASLDSEKVKVEPATHALRPIIDEARAAALSTAQEKNLDISGVVAPAGIHLLVDRVRAIQIFVNLLSNAAKYSPPGAAIGVRVGRPADGMIEVAVWDSGPGIPPEKRDQIFPAFSRLVTDTYKSSPGGAGLGLTIARRLAALMGGWLDLRDRAGGGCEFVVRLPLAEPGTAPARP